MSEKREKEIKRVYIYLRTGYGSMPMLIPNRSRSNRILWLTSCHACLNTMLESSFSLGNEILHLAVAPDPPSLASFHLLFDNNTKENLCYRGGIVERSPDTLALARTARIGIAFLVINLLPHGISRVVVCVQRKVYITTYIP